MPNPVDLSRVRYHAFVRGVFTEITQEEADALMLAPADGVYDEKFRDEQRRHEEQVWSRFDGTRPGDPNA